MRSPCFILLSVLAICGFLPAQTNPIPHVNNPLMPASVAPGSSGFQLTIDGTGFVSGSVVKWNGSPRVTTFVSNSALKATILTSDLKAARTSYVTVSNPGAPLSNAVPFEILLQAPGTGFVATTHSESNECTQAVLYPQVVADFNGDGKLDVAGISCSGGFIYVTLGNGDGTFRTAVFTAVSPSPTYQMLAADLNGDGKADLAFISSSNQVTVLLGNGDGTFQPAKTITTGNVTYSMAAVDMNGDGKLDLVLPASGDNAIDVLLGNGDGTFQPFIASSTGAAVPVLEAVGDFNGDGKLDVAVGDGQVAQVTMMFGNGDGTLSLGGSYAGTFYTITAADLNGDGKLDLVGLGTTSHGGYAGAVYMLGNGDGTFGKANLLAPPAIPVTNYVDQLGVADLNGDGKMDLWTVARVGENEGDSIVSILGNGDGTFQAPSFYQVTPPGFTSFGILEGDFNNDGRPDFQDASFCQNGVNCVLTALQSPIVAAPSAVNFGTTLIGQARSQTITLTNASSNGLSITNFTIGGTNAADFSQTHTCTTTLTAGASCTIKVVFTATKEDFLETATLTISDSGPGGSQVVPLSGIGTYVSESLSSLNFGNVAVGSSSTKVVTLTNTSAFTLTTTEIYVSPSNHEFIQSDNCFKTLGPGAQCQISVTLTPTVKGHIGANLVVLFDGDAPPAIPLSGNGS